MTEDIAVKKDPDWSRFLSRHWKAFAVFIVAVILAIAAAVYVFVWFTGNAQSTDLVPASVGAWTMNNLVLFILHAIFLELVLVGIPIAIAAIAGWQWWKHLPETEKNEYHLFGQRSRSRGAGGAISPLLFIAFAIKVYVDGNWNTTISSYTLNYIVGSFVTILIWIAVVFAIPAIVGLVWWIRHEMNKNS